VQSPDENAVDVVCWDWNGTLLDDTAVALAVMNSVLEERGLAPMPDVEAYRSVFGFPVADFYARLGVVPDEFRAAAGRYLELFAAGVGRARLHDGAAATLASIRRLGVTQVLISATVPDVLARQMGPHALADHFDQVLGTTDAYAPSKTAVVARWLRASGRAPHRVLMVGDTNHDEEIARELGVRFVRFARGHQEPPVDDRYPVVHHLRKVVDHVRPARC